MRIYSLIAMAPGIKFQTTSGMLSVSAVIAGKATEIRTLHHFHWSEMYSEIINSFWPLYRRVWILALELFVICYALLLLGRKHWND